MSTSFDKEYKRLNKAQRQAVDTIEGPVMVVAGPGTGKTQILTLRIANILRETQADAENILALTFTESGVSSMRKRLAELIGSDAYRINITTFHAFANDIIKQYPEYFPHIIGSESITDVDQITIIQDIIEGVSLEFLKPFGDVFLYVKDIIRAIKELKREGVSPEEFTSVVTEELTQFELIDDLYHQKGAHKGKMKGKYVTYKKQIDKNKELSHVYTLYQEKLHTTKQYDFEDMIVEVLRTLEREEDLLRILQEQYQYVLVDEHQDTNNAQNKILELLLNFHPQPNIFVVGDEKQAIYRFQGASLQNFYYFTYLYKEAVIINLSENYRSTQRVLDSAHSVIPKEESLSAALREDDHPVSVVSLPDLSSEMAYVANNIQTCIQEGIEPSEIAVLYRDNRDAYNLVPFLETKEISYIVESDKSIFDEPIIKKLLILLEAVDGFGDSEKGARALHLDLFDISALDIYKVIHSVSKKRKKGLYDILKDEKGLRDIGVEGVETLKYFYTQVSKWAKRAKNDDVVTFIGDVFNTSGMIQRVVENDVEKLLPVIERFYDEVKIVAEKKKGACLADFLMHVHTIQEHNLLIKQSGGQKNKQNIRLMTVHRSKGLEFEYVFIIHAYEGHFGGKRRAERLRLLPRVYKMLDIESHEDEEEKDADERRLFYVALTRAKKSVTVTYPRQLRDGKEVLLSRFAGDIKEGLVERKDIDKVDNTQFLEGIAYSKKPTPLSKDFVRELFLKQGLSVTALNNYLKSPWQYFYQNLIRIPSVPTKHQAYGIAVHSTLEFLFNGLKNEQEITKEDLLHKFTYHLNQQLITESDQKETHKRGVEALSEWFDGYSETWNTNTRSELVVRGVLLTPEIRLTGKIDKLEFLGSDEVNVVDYKTGRARTRNDILGKTKASEGNYYRQLVFYKLLLSLYQEGRYKMVSGEIDFIEPDIRGKLHKEKFTIPDEDVEDLKETIIRVSDEIMNLSFWDTPCDPEKCDYCDLVESIKKI